MIRQGEGGKVRESLACESVDGLERAPLKALTNYPKAGLRMSPMQNDYDNEVFDKKTMAMSTFVKAREGLLCE